MPLIKVLIVEDEELYADKMEMQLDKLGYQHLATVDNSQAAFAILEKERPDLILMDVNIEGEYDGIELADKIHQTRNIPILFITSLEDDRTFKRAKRTNPIGFLAKPFNEIQLRRTVELIINQLENKTEKTDDSEETVFQKDHFFIKNNQQLEKVFFNDIVYLEADGRYTKVITKKKKHLLRTSLQDLIARLGKQQFVQTHRSYALNLKLVTNVDLFEYMVYLGDFHVPLSKRSKDNFLKLLEVV